MATSSGGYKVQIGDYDIFADEGHKLGSGAYGTVYSGRNRFNHKKHVAGKKVTIEAEYLEDGDYQKESDLLLHTIPQHENIIKIHQFSKILYRDRLGKEMIDLWIIMDYAKLGNLKEYAESKVLNLAQKVDIIYQCCLAVNHLHGCKPDSITHRDLKPQNFVLLKCKKRVVVKLVDFGNARTVQRISGRSKTMSSFVGTETYWAPEQVPDKGDHLHHGKCVDVFSLALTVLALLDSTKGVAMAPFKLKGKSLGYAMWEMIHQHGSEWSGFTPNIKNSDDGLVTKDIKRILMKMLQTEPSDRITMEEVVERMSVVKSQYSETDLPPCSSSSSSDSESEEAYLTKPKCPTAHTIARKATHEAKSSPPSAHPSSIDSDTVPEMRPAEAAMCHLDNRLYFAAVILVLLAAITAAVVFLGLRCKILDCQDEQHSAGDPVVGDLGQSCAPGSVLHNGKVCVRCPLGTIPGDAECIDCPAGSYSDSYPASSCMKCPVGTFQNQLGAKECMKCPVGKFNSKTGATECGNCTVGTFNSKTGALECNKCPVGTFNSKTGAIECDKCPVGTFNSKTGAIECDNCPVGTFSNQSGVVECDNCPLGTFQNKTRATECNNCPVGTFQNKTGAIECGNCPVGTFSNQSGVVECDKCPVGTFSDRSGAIRCTLSKKSHAVVWYPHLPAIVILLIIKNLV